MQDITTPFLVAVPLVLGLVQVAKVSGLSTKLAPLASVVLGVLAAFTVAGFSFSSFVLLQGLVIGLSSCGLWSGVKTTTA